jgi:hypothetical protein
MFSKAWSKPTWQLFRYTEGVKLGRIFMLLLKCSIRAMQFSDFLGFPRPVAFQEGGARASPGVGRVRRTRRQQTSGRLGEASLPVQEYWQPRKAVFRKLNSLDTLPFEGIFCHNSAKVGAHHKDARAAGNVIK